MDKLRRKMEQYTPSLPSYLPYVFVKSRHLEDGGWLGDPGVSGARRVEVGVCSRGVDVWLCKWRGHEEGRQRDV